MTEKELIITLKEMYDNALTGEQVASIHLFGIKYVNELKNKNIKNIVMSATGKESYFSEINKGMKLSSLLAQNNLIKIKKSSSDNVKSGKETVNMNIKNIILYGAPGVGKTHNYKNMISLIEQGNSQKEIFDSIQANELFDDEDDSFQNVKDEKRVEFITFHQSFSYEDFIEGFRPQESGKLEIEDGIFKLISKNAKNQVLQKETKTISFDDAYDMLREKYFENALDKIYSVSDVEILIHEFKENTLKVQSSNAKDNQYVKKSDLETVVNSFMKDEIKKPSDIKKLDVKKDTISLAGLYFPFGKLISQIMKENKISEEKEKNFYLVIDEINRGNISKIFGELITLIEESKRDKYEVTLPYSKQKFSIPSNLYIIGTMNTTDKSIALIDVALRRRFTFIKMKPNTDLVLKSFQDTFEKLNKKITEHIGEDYQIGHSYFMNIDDGDLSFVLEYKIKPLLEEYYYGDDRISEVLDILGIN
ncbi:MAG: AAA family ATPase [Aliarcobacter sp.]|nr:AAA family ATPase [Aliarcobacter sp.]